MAKGNQKDLFHSSGNSTVSLPKHVDSGKRTKTNPYIDRKGPAKKHSNKHAIQPGWSK
jgi:hypothetical protein